MVYIKRLTIQGFKSFGAKRSSLNLVRGFIVITGPNGGGKSNVLDAIKFALGELSAQSLRVSRLSELINESGAGGKTSYARVSVTLDNSDRGIPLGEDEIKITRKMTPSGESVYQLNNRVVSRVELLTLLSSANIKSSGFNIITQGAVLGIAEMSADELRGMLEEVAGTAEYDKRKSEALEEMSKAERNIAVAKAGTSEVKQRVRQLEKEKTQLLRKMITEREVLRLRAESLRNELLSIESELREKEEEEKSLAEERLACEGKLSSMIGVKASLREDLARKEAILKEKEEELSEKYRQVEALYREMERVKIGIRTSGMRYVKTKHQLMEIASLSTGLSEKRASLLEGLRGLLPERQRLLSWLEELSAKLSELKGRRDSLASMLKELEVREEERRRREEAIRREILRREREVESRSGRSQWLMESLRRSEERLAKLEEEMGALSDSISKMDDEIREVEGRKKLLSDELASMERRRELLAKRRSRIVGVLDEIERVNKEAEARILKEGEEPLSISRCIATGLGDGEVVGVLADLTEPPRGMEALFRSMLGEAINAIVVRSAFMARALATVAAENGIALTVISVDRSRPTSHERCLACLTKPRSPEASSALHAALGRVGVVEEMESSPRHQFLTKSGVYFDGESIYRSLGRVSITQRLIDTLEELKELSKRLSERIERIDEEESAMAGRAQLMRNELALLEQRGREVEMERMIAAERAGKLIAERREIETFMERARRDLEGVEKERESMRREVEELYTQLSGDAPETARQRDGLMRSIEIIDDEIDSTSRLYASANSEASSLSERIRSMEEELRRVEEGIESSSEREGKLEREAESEKRVLREQAALFNEYLQRYSTAISGAEALRDEISHLKKECGELQEKLNALMSEIEDARQRLSDLNSRLQSLQIVLVEKRMRLGSVRDRLSEMRVDQNDELGLLGIEAKSSILRELEGELAGMELVNQLAPMQYSQIIENYRFRAARIAELENERRELLRIIERIDAEKIEVFTSVLSRVSQGFGFFFNKLTGGEAWLELSDPEKPLETGVEMILRFVGKPPRSSRGVSGGEKSVAAISLLMALQGLTPADFYIFDEVDAHMDVAYTKNLAALFKEMSTKTQIITVSLKDIMAEHADQLIGVYSQMGESRIVLTRLGEAIEKSAG